MSVLSISLPVFGVIFTGNIAAKKDIIQPAATKILTNYVLYFAMPFLLFTTMAKVPLGNIFNFAYIGAYALSLLAVAAISFLLFKLTSNKPLSFMTLRVMDTCFVNSAYLGIPLLVGAFGNATPVVLVIIFQVIFITPIILTLLEIGSGGQKSALNIIKDLPFVVIKTR
jgi:predicted permease